MRHLDLFTGILGFALSAYWVWGEDYELVATCEIDPFCKKIIKARTSDGSLGERNRDVPIISDIRNVTYGKVMADTIDPGSCETERDATIQKSNEQENGVSKRNGYSGKTDRTKIDLLTGGFPCQPFSVAGKRRGKEDDRFLWDEMLRVIQEFHPTWIIGENVAGINSIFQYESVPPMDNEGNPVGKVGDIYSRTGGGVFSQILEDLEPEGYEVQPLIIPACAVDAPHRRDRVWIVGRLNTDLFSDTKGGAHRRKVGLCHKGWQESCECQWNEMGCNHANLCQTMANTSCTRRARRERCGQTDRHGGRKEIQPQGKSKENNWITKFSLGDKNDGLSRWMARHLGYRWDDGSWDTIPRMSKGEKDRVNRLKALGNSIVPVCVMPIMAAIKALTTE